MDAEPTGGFETRPAATIGHRSSAMDAGAAEGGFETRPYETACRFLSALLAVTGVGPTVIDCRAFSLAPHLARM